MVSPPASADVKPSFSIVLVNYKTADITKICLDLLYKSLSGLKGSVWVVDNNSADESLDYLRTLDWINLIERRTPEAEPGHVAHGHALDLALQAVDTDYLFLMHTDTFIYDPKIFEIMLRKCIHDPKIFAVGCLEQINRGSLRNYWRLSSRFTKHHFRKLKISLGLKSRAPKPFRETYLKSFFALWNIKAMKAHHLHFSLNERIPGYEAQDRMKALGYRMELLSPNRIFRYLEHIQAGTVAAAGTYGKNHRRTRTYQAALSLHKR